MKSKIIALILGGVAVGGFGVVYYRIVQVEVRIDHQRANSQREEPVARPDTPESRTPLESGAQTNEPAAAATQSTGPKKAGKGTNKWRGKKNPRNSTAYLVKALELTDAQRADFVAILDQARLLADDTLKIRDRTGGSPYERRAALQKLVYEAVKTGEWGAVKEAWTTPIIRNEPIPGRSTTYRLELAHIEQRTRAELAKILSERQRNRFATISIRRMVTRGGTTPGEVVADAKIAAMARKKAADR